MISPKLNYFLIEVYKCTYNITNRPSFPIRQIIFIPFLDSIPIISIGSLIISNSPLRIKRCLQSSPTYLHQATCFKLDLIVISSGKDACVGSDRCETTNSFYIKIISPRENNVSICAFRI